MRKISITLLAFKSLVVKIKYLKKECKKKDAYIDMLKTRIKNYNDSFTKNV